MLTLDHLAIWTEQRDRLTRRLSDLTGFPILDGFAPEGRPVARGVRFVDGAFVDLHQVGDGQPAGQVLLGLRGEVDAVEALALRQGWGVRVGRWAEATDGSPWSILSFRRGQGILTQLFVIEYGPRPQAWASPVFDQPLYDPVNAAPQGAALRRVWLRTADPRASGAILEALGFVAAGQIASRLEPGVGRLFRGAAGDLVLTLGADEAVIRFDLDGPAPPSCEPITERLRLVVGDTP
ncbi:hypothetical protein [Phenylobacterium sp.]|uniref:hypothetical protein n=1 Tax=Phenylobacterium sp. TaxID=1871053 RepID=UPI002736F428|nr:hypothetical protein [Phenylobacterium sp.]MDP3854679.1 hypothetical protein [Phenylobacterium sp.]